MYYYYDKISKEFPISAFANMCKNILDVISSKKFSLKCTVRLPKKRVHFNAFLQKRKKKKKLQMPNKILDCPNMVCIPILRVSSL